ncbi:MAG: hypothetical protein IPG59_12850 [Candidatus Melainabacteria bacterium]|nr:MAG: hypothetical protein IPG59_12850 [Candidatus Melainabacteria bacterium]
MKTRNDAHETTSLGEALDWAREKLQAGDDIVRFNAAEHPSGQGWRGVIEVRMSGDELDRPAQVDPEFLKRIRNEKPLIDPADLPDLLD